MAKNYSLATFNVLLTKMMTDMNLLSKRLSELIKLHQVSQSLLAKHLSVGQQTVSKYASGKIEPSLDILIKIAKFFDVSTDYLLGLEN